MTNETQKLLYTFKQGEKFIHNNKLYTVYQHDKTMTEVYSGGRFWAWPNYDGKDSIKVIPIVL